MQIKGTISNLHVADILTSQDHMYWVTYNHWLSFTAGFRINSCDAVKHVIHMSILLYIQL